MTDHAELRRLAEQASYFDITTDWMFKPVIAFQKASDPKIVLALLDEIDRLKSESDTLRKDAARYRALRQEGRGVVVVRDRVSHLFENKLDAAIDAIIEGDK
ncbi:TPA: hypothetical protein ACMFP1_002958 [Pseudomonas aeruginosa]|nr:hypothetical protein [Pseudomonas aeruginosa]